MDPKNQPQFNPKIPISEVLKQEQTGYTPSVPVSSVQDASIPPTPFGTPAQPAVPVQPKKITLKDVVSAMNDKFKDINTAEEKNSEPVTPAQTQAPIEGATNPTTIDVPATKIIKTYRSDAAEAVRMQQASVSKIAMAQEKQRRAQGEEIGAEKPKKKIGLLLAAIILLALGAAAIPAVQYILNQKTVAVQTTAEKTIIPFDHQEILTLDNVTRDNFLSGLDTLSIKPPTATAIDYIKILKSTQDVNSKPTTQLIAPDIFAGMIGPNMPSALARSFDSDYMFGIANSENPKPFILFKTSSYQQTFANMLKWENKMITDLSPVLNLSQDVIGRPFTDRVVISKDVRAVTAPDGTILFLYGFLDNQTLIITTNTQTFQDLNAKYVAARFVQ